MDVAAAAGDLAHGIDQFSARRLLQHVAAGSGRERLAHVAWIVLHREHQHLRRGRLLEQLRRHLDAALSGHHDVDENHVRLARASLEDSLAPVARLADGLDVGRRVEHVAQPGPHDRMVVDDQDADHLRGTSATIVVPAPSLDSICSRPFSSAMRSSIPTRPRPSSRPAPASKPRPSSSITAITLPLLRVTRTLTELARACLTTLVSDSWTMR